MIYLYLIVISLNTFVQTEGWHFISIGVCWKTKIINKQGPKKLLSSDITII
jgi:hypothetical protein